MLSWPQGTMFRFGCLFLVHALSLFLSLSVMLLPKDKTDVSGGAAAVTSAWRQQRHRRHRFVSPFFRKERASKRETARGLSRASFQHVRNYVIPVRLSVGGTFHSGGAFVYTQLVTRATGSPGGNIRKTGANNKYTHNSTAQLPPKISALSRERDVVRVDFCQRTNGTERVVSGP